MLGVNIDSKLNFVSQTNNLVRNQGLLPELHLDIREKNNNESNSNSNTNTINTTPSNNSNNINKPFSIIHVVIISRIDPVVAIKCNATSDFNIQSLWCHCLDGISPIIFLL